ncbi:MAG: hypothetical protein WCI77_00800 [Candidatus Omnitrophota bacterium]
MNSLLDKTKKYIIAYAHGGISNRIKCVVSALRWANALKREVALYWPKDYTCNCAFQDLFENKITEIGSDVYENFEKHRFFSFFHNKYTLMDTWRLLVFGKELRRGFGNVYPKALGESGGGSIDLEYERVPEAIREKFLIYFNNFVPVTYVRDQVNIFSQRFNKSTVSVAIRTWVDSGWRSKLFDINEFYRIMDTFPDANFFVTSDSSEIVRILAEKYNDRIIYYPKRTANGDRSSVEGVQDTLIDLLLASKNKFLVGSHLSTFSEVAWWFGECQAKVSIASRQKYRKIFPYRFYIPVLSFRL